MEAAGELWCLSISVSEQCGTLGWRQGRALEPWGSSLMGNLQSLSCAAGDQTIPITWENGFSLPPQCRIKSTVCSQPVHSHPHTPFFHVGSLRAAKQRDFSNFMYCKCHSYKQDEKRTQSHSCRGTACASAVARPLSLQTGSSAPHSAWYIQHRI